MARLTFLCSVSLQPLGVREKSLDIFPLLFPWFDDILPHDRRPWEAGKLFDGQIDVPLLG